MSSYDYLTNELDRIIPYIIKKKFIIYPYGEMGEMAKKYLEEKYHIVPSFILDNHKALQNTDYFTTQKLSEINCSEFYFLIASNSSQYYSEIRGEIKKYVSDKNIIDLFPRMPIDKKNMIDKFIYNKMLYPHGKNSFLHSLKNKKNIRVLDVGCGNRSPQNVKTILDKVYYVGIDVGDYNQSEESKRYADEYHIVKGEEFAAQIEKYRNSFDAVICCHNIEHCNEPERVLNAMIASLKKNGKLYLAFPSEESVNFPRGRRGCLNFYDDSTHNEVPNWKKINDILFKHKMKIIFKTKNNRPYILRKIGALNETKSRELRTVLEGTWEFYGFESIIWAKKMERKNEYK